MVCYFIRHGKDDDSVREGWSQHALMDEGAAQAAEPADFMQRSALKSYRIDIDLSAFFQLAKGTKKL